MRVQGSDTAALQSTVFTQVCLEHIRKELHAFSIGRHRDQYHTPRNLLLALIAEIAVLAQIFQWKGDVTPSLADLSAAERQHVGHELSGVLLYLIRMADVCGVDLGRAALDKLARQEALGPMQKEPHSANPGLSPQQQVLPQQQQRAKQQQQQYGTQPGLGSPPLQPAAGQPGALASLPHQQQQKQQGLQLSAFQQQQWQQQQPQAVSMQQGVTQQQQQQQQQPHRQHLPPSSLAAHALTGAAGSPVRAASAAVGKAGLGSAAAMQGLLSATSAAALSPVSSSISSISVGLLRQLAMLSSINPSAAIALLTANPAATASLMAAITDPNHQVAALLSAALTRGSGSSSAQGLGGVAAGLWGLAGAPAATVAAEGLGQAGLGALPQQQQPQQGRQLTQQQRQLLNNILAAAAAARGDAGAGPAPPAAPTFGLAPGTYAAAPAPPPPPPAAAAAGPAKLQVDSAYAGLTGQVSTAAATAAAAAGAAGATPFAGAAAPITPPAGTAADVGATVLPAFAAAATAAAAAAEGSGGEPAHSGPSTGRQQRQPALLPHRQPQQQISLSHSVGSSSSSSSGDEEGTSGDQGAVDQPMVEAQSPSQQELALSPVSAPAAAAAAAGGWAGMLSAPQQQQQQQQQQQVPVRRQLDQQQLLHLTQIAQAAHWSLAELTAKQQEDVCSTLGVGPDLLARFFEEEGAGGGGPRGVKRGLDRSL